MQEVGETFLRQYLLFVFRKFADSNVLVGIFLIQSNTYCFCWIFSFFVPTKQLRFLFSPSDIISPFLRKYFENPDHVWKPADENPQ